LKAAHEGVQAMIEPMNDPDLSNRPFSYYHLSGKKFLKWVESKDYELPPTNPPLSNEVQFQVEWFLAEMMRSISKNLTGEKILKQAKVILQKDDEKILEDLNPLGKFFLGSLKHDGGFPENRAPLAEFFLGSQRSTYWRNLISDAVYLGELTLLDYPTLKPITEKQKIKSLAEYLNQWPPPIPIQTNKKRLLMTRWQDRGRQTLMLETPKPNQIIEVLRWFGLMSV